MSAALTVRMDDSRVAVMLECAWEIDALARALPDQVPRMDGTMAAQLVVRGMSARLSQLAESLMSGLSEPEMNTKQLERAVFFGAEREGAA